MPDSPINRIPELAAMCATETARRRVTDEVCPGWWEQDRSAFVGATAANLSLLLWSTTILEALHTGSGERPCPPAVAGQDETRRLNTIVRACPGGGGLPDDMTLRMAAATTSSLRDMLDDALPDRAALLSGAPDPAGANEVAWRLADLLQSPQRTMQIGTATITARHLFDYRSWNTYTSTVYDGVGELLAAVDAYGWAGYLTIGAVRSARLGTDRFWAGRRWAQRVSFIRSAARQPDETFVWGGTPPNGDAEWEQMEHTPWLLHGTTAYWLKFAQRHASACGE